jgi:hypothetical protein
VDCKEEKTGDTDSQRAEESTSGYHRHARSTTIQANIIPGSLFNQTKHDIRRRYNRHKRKPRSENLPDIDSMNAGKVGRPELQQQIEETVEYVEKNYEPEGS